MAPSTPDCSLSGQPPYNCEGCDLSGRNLAGKDLTGANLRHTTLTGTIFAGTISVAGADLTGARMGSGTDFTGCDLSRTIFGSNPDFGSNPAQPTKLIGSTIPYAVLGSTWRFLDLTGCKIAGLPQDLTWLEITQCNLPAFVFANHTMTNAHLSGVNLQGADFSAATLDNIVFQQGDDGIVCDLTDASFRGAELTEAVFDSSTLTRTDFTGATLTGISLRQTRMDGTIFDGADLTTARFSSPPRFSSDPANLTSLRRATLNLSSLAKQWSYLDLTAATLIGLDSSVDLSYLQAQCSVLTGRDFSHYTLNNCNLRGATLTGVHFSHALMASAQLYGVQNSSERFRVRSTSSDYQPLLAALTADNAAALVSIFARYGLTLSPTRTTVTTDNPKQWWTVTDTSTGAIYPVRSQSGKLATLVVMDLSLITKFDAAQLPDAHFSPLGAQRTSLRGSDFTGTTLDGADFSDADISQLNPYQKSTKALFTRATMMRAGLSQADLTGADLTGTVYLHGADLSMGIMENADLTGAQLGALAELFRVPSTSADFQTLISALRARDVGAVATIFAAHQHPITTGQSSIATVVADRDWSVTDSAAQRTYTILNWSASDGSTFLIISTPTPAATLTGAYLPGAKLTDANLYGVSAPHVQLYGTTVHLDGAILDNCTLSYANLGGSSIIVKALYNVDLSDANLINATLKGADLSQGVTLAYANLQGTVLTGTSMNTADLTNAAVAVPLDASTAGVFLFAVHRTDPDYPLVLAELQAAVGQLNLTPGMSASQIKALIGDLNSGNLSPLRRLFGQNGVTFSATATIGPTSVVAAWQILDAAPPGNYTVWHGFDDLGDETLLARPSLPELARVFTRYATVAGTLCWQASISAGTGSKVWLLDNDSLNPKNLQLGYATMLVNCDPDGSLAFYGTTLRIRQLGDDNQLQIRIMSYGPTILCPVQNGALQCAPDGSASVFGPATVCPDARTLSQNQNSVPPVPWAQMLRAVPPPTPPVCVPSPYGNCPMPTPAGIAEIESARS